VLSDINTTSFPCLGQDPIVVEDIPFATCAQMEQPPADMAYMSSTIEGNRVDFCAEVGGGYVTAGQVKYYGLAALVVRSPNPADTNEYIYALEQFPVMSKTTSVVFSFLWSCYF